MLRQEMVKWAASLLEGVCMLAEAHEHSHMQLPVRFPQSSSMHPRQVKIREALNAAFLSVDHDCDDEIERGLIMILDADTQSAELSEY